MTRCRCTARLSIISFAIALGVLSGICMMLFAWYAFWYGRGIPQIAQWSEIYSGYGPTLHGGLIGFAWGFLEGFLSGLILAIIYNLSLCCCRAFCHREEECESKTTRTVIKK